ncbi:MAG: flavin reductase family protein [Candidatus Jordarchaeaceae archaeon]
MSKRVKNKKYQPYSKSNNSERWMMLSLKKELTPSIALYPTPVVLATSIDEKGKPNICTLAWAGVVCSEPPQIGISIRPSRYSHGLISKTMEYVVNIPTSDIVKETDYCGMVTGKNVDKFKETKLTPVKAKKVKPPLIKECPVNLECKVKNVIKLGAHDLFIGEIVNINADADVMDSPTSINFGKLKAITWNPISREYYTLGKALGVYGFSQQSNK